MDTDVHINFNIPHKGKAMQTQLHESPGGILFLNFTQKLELKMC